MTTPTFEQLEERAKKLFSANMPIEAWGVVDEGVRSYWLKKALELPLELLSCEDFAGTGEITSAID